MMFLWEKDQFSVSCQCLMCFLMVNYLMIFIRIMCLYLIYLNITSSLNALWIRAGEKYFTSIKCQCCTIHKTNDSNKSVMLMSSLKNKFKSVWNTALHNLQHLEFLSIRKHSKKNISSYYQCLMKKSSKVQHLFEIESFCNIINVFIASFNQFNASLLNKKYFEKVIWKNGSVWRQNGDILKIKPNQNWNWIKLESLLIPSPNYHCIV